MHEGFPTGPTWHIFLTSLCHFYVFLDRIHKPCFKSSSTLPRSISSILLPSDSSILLRLLINIIRTSHCLHPWLYASFPTISTYIYQQCSGREVRREESLQVINSMNRCIIAFSYRNYVVLRVVLSCSMWPSIGSCVAMLGVILYWNFLCPGQFDWLLTTVMLDRLLWLVTD